MAVFHSPAGKFGFVMKRSQKYNVAMLYLIFLSAFLAIFLLRLSVFPHKKWAAVFAAFHVALFFLLSITWLASDYFTGEGFNEAVEYHLRVGLGGAGVTEYLGILFLTLVLLVAALFFSWRVARFLSEGSTERNSAGAVICLLALPVVCILHPTVNGILGGFNASLYGSGSVLARAVSETGKPGESARFSDYFVQPEVRWKAKQSPNLVMLYVESLERTYFDEDRFPGLITELRELEPDAVSFSDIRQLHGTGFTMGGVVSSQCGLPLTTTGHPNSLRGMDQFMPAAMCMGDVLSTRDYAVHYMGGARLNFAGKGKFFESHSFDSVSGLTALKPLLDDPAYVHSWGIYDDFLLDQFFQRFENLSLSDSPFALFGLTMDTHHPNGHPSRSCQGVEYGDGSNRILNAVKCADRLVAEIIRKIRQSEWGKETVLVVASDHLALKNGALDRLSSGPRRNLLWTFPAGDFQPGMVAKPGSTLDTPATVLGYLGAEVSAFGLGKSLVGDSPVLQSQIPRTNWQIREWRKDIQEFWRLPGFIESLQVSPADLQVTINGRNYQAPALIEIDQGTLGSVRFAFDSDVTLDRYVKDADPSSVVAWIDECKAVRAMSMALPSSGHCVFVGKPGAEEAFVTTLEKDIQFDAASLRRLSKMPVKASFTQSRQESLDAYQEYGSAGIRHFSFEWGGVSQSGHLQVLSSGGPGSISAVDDGKSRQQLERGIHLMAVDQGMHAQPVAMFDVCSEISPIPVSINEAMRTEGEVVHDFIIVSHYSSTCGEPLDDLFEGLGLRRWRQLELRHRYVAVLPHSDSAGESVELVGQPYTSLAIEVLPAK